MPHYLVDRNHVNFCLCVEFITYEGFLILLVLLCLFSVGGTYLLAVFFQNKPKQLPGSVVPQGESALDIGLK